MRTVKHYLTVETIKVQNYIDNGWQPWGSPFLQANYPYQAMVMYEAELAGEGDHMPTPEPSVEEVS